MFRKALTLFGTAAVATVMAGSQPAGAGEAVRQPERDRVGELAKPSGPAARPQNPAIGGLVDCPPGYHLSPFEKPIYDEDGLFVVGYETVWYCLPDDLEPAG